MSAMEAAWAAAKRAWPGFEFLWEPGATPEAVRAANERLGLELPSQAVEAITLCQGAGFPAPNSPGSGAAEACLAAVEHWCKVPQDVLDLDVLGDLTPIADRVVLIGDNAWGVDYTILVMMNPDDASIHRLTLNTGEVEPLGTFEQWLGGVRLGNPGKPEAEFLDEPEDLQELAETHRFKLSIEGYLGNHAARLERWEQLEARFLEKVAALRAAPLG